MQYNSSEKEERVLLYQTKVSNLSESQEPPRFVSQDYNTQEEYVKLTHAMCTPNGTFDTDEILFMYVPAHVLFEYMCDPCVDELSQVGIYGMIKTITKYIKYGYRSCVLVTEEFYVHIDTTNTNLSVNQFLIVNQEELASRKHQTINFNTKSMELISGGDCESIYWNISYVSFVFTEDETRFEEILINATHKAKLNTYLLYSYYNTDTNITITGYFTTLSISTVVGMADNCNYECPISCSDGESTHCFLQDVKPVKCTPEQAYCDQVDCKNGATCKKYGNISGCTCASRYFGHLCDNKDCDEDCNNGVCNQNGNCSCHSGWVGSSCSNRVRTEDDCNGTDCNTIGDNFECACNPHTNTGPHCVFTCEPNCKNGNCTMLGESPVCLCVRDSIFVSCTVLDKYDFLIEAENRLRLMFMLALCLVEVAIIVVTLIIILVVNKSGVAKIKAMNAKCHVQNDEQGENINMIENIDCQQAPDTSNNDAAENPVVCTTTHNDPNDVPLEIGTNNSIPRCDATAPSDIQNTEKSDTENENTESVY